MEEPDERVRRREALRERIEARYPDLDLTHIQLDNYLDAQERTTGGEERLEAIGQVEVHEVTNERVEDLLSFFDRDAFADNPGWASCYCVYHHLGNDIEPPWDERSWKDNRALLERRVGSGKTRGFLAYVDGKPAGWLNASNRAEFPDHAEGDDEGVASLVCFVVAPPYRRHGLANELLQKALDVLPTAGISEVQAYPVVHPETLLATYRGPMPLLEKHGFEVIDEHEGTATMRKSLSHQPRP